MGFLQSAEILIPALTDMPVTIYTGQQEVLHGFEKTYCFSADIQEIFTAKALHSFLEKRPNEYIYEIREPMGARLTVFKAGEPWILLGPYINTPWDEKKAKNLFPHYIYHWKTFCHTRIIVVIFRYSRQNLCLGLLFCSLSILPAMAFCGK